MKGYIVSAGVLFILMFFVLQFTSGQIAHYKKNTMINIVETFTQQARMEGQFTTDIQTNLVNEIKTKVKTEEVVTEFTETLVCTREGFNQSNMINYKVKIPMRDVIAMAKFFNIPEADNMYWFTLQGSVSSEKLCSL